MINKETIISVFDEKLTLLQWLKSVNKALVEATLSSVSVEKRGSATYSFVFNFEDGTQLKTNDIMVAKGDSVVDASIENGHLMLSLSNEDVLDAGDVKPVSSFSFDLARHLIVEYQDGTSQDLGLIKGVSRFLINESNHLIVEYDNGTSDDLGDIFASNVAFGGNVDIAGTLEVDGNADFNSDVDVDGNANIDGVLTANAISGGVNTDNGHKYKIVACILRNTGGVWDFITSGKHRPLNCASVSQDATGITINYGFTAKGIISLVVTPDEDFAEQGYFCGASVADNKAIIQIYKREGVCGGYITHNSGSWTFTNDITNVSFDGASGYITIDHTYVGSRVYGRSVTCKSGKYIASIVSAGTTSDVLALYDYSGNIVTAPSNNTSIFWLSMAPHLNKLVIPSEANQTGNLWVYGIMEVD